MFAVVKIGSTQHIVKPDQEVLIDYQGKTEQKLTFKDVLLVVDSDKVVIGRPTIENAFVEADLIDTVKADKVRVGKFKAKSRYRKVTGHRAKLTHIKISRISLDGGKEAVIEVSKPQAKPRVKKAKLVREITN